MRQMHGVCGAGMRSSKMICAGDNRVIDNGVSPALCLMWRFRADRKLLPFISYWLEKQPAALASGGFSDGSAFTLFSIMYSPEIQEVLKCNHLAKGESINYKQSLYEPQNIDRIEKRANPVYGIIGKNLADAIQNRGDYVHYCRTWKPGQAVPEYTA